MTTKSVTILVDSNDSPANKGRMARFHLPLNGENNLIGSMIKRRRKSSELSTSIERRNAS